MSEAFKSNFQTTSPSSIVLDGGYIGKHLEYLNHQDLIDGIISDVDLDEDFRERTRSGNLATDKNVRIDINWTDTGYSAYFERTNQAGRGQLFEVGIDDLEKPGMASRFSGSKKRILSLPPRLRPYWIRFKVTNDGNEPVEFLIELDRHLFDYINAYVPTEEGYRLKRESFETFLDQHEFNYKHFVFKLSADKGENTYYLFVNSWANWLMIHFQSESDPEPILSNIHPTMG